MTEYAAHAAGPSGQVRYIRRARHDAPEWYGLTDDQTLVSIWEHLDVRDGHKHRRLSKQMVRVCTRALESKLKLNPEQALAFADSVAGRNVFLTGGAGVGKSHTLTQIVRFLKPGSYAVTASTGCAAAIIGASTLHSTMCIGLGTQPAKTYAIKIKEKNPCAFVNLRNIRTLILDEASMMDGATFNKAGLVYAMLKRCFLDPTHGCDGPVSSYTLWDRLQIICCGDFMQLPPVQVKENGWIFNSRAWKQLEFRNHVLAQVHRQSGDPAFCDVLKRVRMGLGTHADFTMLTQGCAQAPTANSLQLFALNKPADELNVARFRALVTAGAMPHTFSAIDHAKNPAHLAKLEQCQAPKHLHLCLGARVMCLRNLVDGKLVNGSTGTVTNVRPFTDLNSDKVVGATVDVLFDGLLGSEPFAHTFRTYESTLPEAQVARELEFTVMEGSKKIASRIQIPLKLAWAISIHKSQGMSLERANVDFNGIFEYGQAYTALSRMRTLAGVYICNLKPMHLRMASERAKGWYDSLTVQEWDRA